ncbi:MAG: hypothetical protein KatS3mg097_376 [Candidatus Parcubacteria bacterium]|nr:MAG: hypothetical protein KatS3mg097_376 [Candidatus Parcubacteria bacterium]
MQQNYLQQFLFIIMILIIFSPIFIKAARVDLASIVVCSATPCTWGDFIATLQNVIKAIVEISFYLTVLFSVIGSFMIMFHGPRPDFYQKGKSFIQISITGYIILLFSALIFDTILGILQPQFVSQYFFKIIEITKILSLNNYFN